jgi:hypothetical protein
LRREPLPARLERGRIVPAFLGAQDHPWLAVLIEEVGRFTGRPLRLLLDRLRAPLPCAAPYFKCKAATAVVLGLWRARERAAVDPRAARAALFTEAAAPPARRDRAAVVAAAATRLGVEAADLEGALFADLPGERVVEAPAEAPSPQDLALRVNLALVRRLLARSSLVRVRAEGGLRPVVRQAHLRGLLVTVRDGAPPELEISGPLALFRRTLLYGRALGELLPFLARTARFELVAECHLEGSRGELHLSSGDPIFPAAAPRAFDSRLEERFARDFARAAPDWDLIREPEAVRAGGSLVFPDFLAVHRLAPARRFFLEIVGFWTPEYLARKLASLRACGIPDLILAVDVDRRCAEGDLPPSARVVWYRRRVDPAAVLAAAAGLSGARGPPPAIDGGLGEARRRERR